MVEKIQEISTKSIMTKSNLPIAGYSVNPYVGCPHGCKYCYASFMKRVTNHPEPWGTFLDVKNWTPIRNPQRYKGKSIIIGSVTDAYHPLEEKYKRTRLFLEQIQGSGANLIITTKSDLVLRDLDLRDLDLIKTFPNPLVSWSINTLDEKFRADMDSASTIEQRINAMKIFHNAGIRTTCFISPIFPGITDVLAIIEQIKDKCDYIWLENLNLRGSYKSAIMGYIINNYPALVPLYKEIYEDKIRKHWINLNKRMERYVAENGYMYLIDKEPFQKNPTGKPIIINYFYHEEIRQSAKK